MAFRLKNRSGPAGQLPPPENPTNGAQREQRAHPQVVQLPRDGLIAAEEPFVVQTEPHQLDELFDRYRGAVRAGPGTPGGLLTPGGIGSCVPGHPFVQPGA